MATAIGVSSYDDGTRTSPRGKTQYLADEAGRQCIALLNAVNKKAGYNAPGKPRFTPNEGQRPAERCNDLYGGYAARGYTAPKVAVPLTSNHYPGHAVDFGITMPDGSNRAMRSDEVAILDSLLADYGFRADGYSFGELWHKGYYGSPRLIAPVGIKLDVYGAKPAKPQTPAVPESVLEGNLTDMFAIELNGASSGVHKGLPKGAQFICDTREKTLTRVDHNPTVSAAALQTLKDEFGTYVAVQPGKKPLAWGGNTPYRYVDGGYARKGF